MRFAISLLLMLFAFAPGGLKSAFSVLANDDWSEAVNGLQARLEFVEKEKINGTRWLAPHIELRNVRDLSNQMEVNCDRFPGRGSDRVSLARLFKAGTFSASVASRGSDQNHYATANPALKSRVRINRRCGDEYVSLHLFFKRHKPVQLLATPI